MSGERANVYSLAGSNNTNSSVVVIGASNTTNIRNTVHFSFEATAAASLRSLHVCGIRFHISHDICSPKMHDFLKAQYKCTHGIKHYLSMHRSHCILCGLSLRKSSSDVSPKRLCKFLQVVNINNTQINTVNVNITSNSSPVSATPGTISKPYTLKCSTARNTATSTLML